MGIVFLDRDRVKAVILEEEGRLVVDVHSAMLVGRKYFYDNLRWHRSADLLHSRFAEFEVVVIIGQTADLLVLPVVASAYNVDRNQILHSAAVLITGHSVDLIHGEHSLAVTFNMRRTVGECGERLRQ